jgi:hypothetical protein
MASIGKYNIPDHYKNDTFDGLSFALKYTDDDTPIDLTGASIKVQFRRNSERGTLAKELNIGTGITMLDDANGAFQIDSFIIDWNADIYYYDVEITYADAVVKTYVKGKLKVIQDITYE